MVDEKLDDQVWVTVVATGYGERAPRAPSAGALEEPAGEPRVERRTRRARAEPARRAGLGRRPSSTSPSSSRRTRALSRTRPAGRASQAARADDRSGHGRWHVAAGHPLTAEAGARVLREGGNAVDAAVAAMLTSWVAEPLLTGPGAGGYLLVAGRGRGADAARLLRRGAGPRRRPGEPRARCVPVDVSFGDAVQVFHVGAASCGVYGNPAGVAAAARRWGTRAARRTSPRPPPRSRATGVPRQRRSRPTSSRSSSRSSCRRPRRARRSRPAGRVLREGERFAAPELADTIERLGAEGAAPFYTGDIGGGGRRVGREPRRRC